MPPINSDTENRKWLQEFVDELPLRPTQSRAYRDALSSVSSFTIEDIDQLLRVNQRQVLSLKPGYCLALAERLGAVENQATRVSNPPSAGQSKPSNAANEDQPFTEKMLSSWARGLGLAFSKDLDRQALLQEFSVLCFDHTVPSFDLLSALLSFKVEANQNGHLKTLTKLNASRSGTLKVNPSLGWMIASFVLRAEDIMSARWLPDVIKFFLAEVQILSDLHKAGIIKENALSLPVHLEAYTQEEIDQLLNLFVQWGTICRGTGAPLTAAIFFKLSKHLVGDIAKLAADNEIMKSYLNAERYERAAKVFQKLSNSLETDTENFLKLDPSVVGKFYLYASELLILMEELENVNATLDLSLSFWEKLSDIHPIGAKQQMAIIAFLRCHTLKEPDSIISGLENSYEEMKALLVSEVGFTETWFFYCAHRLAQLHREAGETIRAKTIVVEALHLMQNRNLTYRLDLQGIRRDLVGIQAVGLATELEGKKAVTKLEESLRITTQLPMLETSRRLAIAMTQLQLGIAYQSVGKHKEAVNSFKTALDKFPKYYKDVPHLQTARLMGMLGYGDSLLILGQTAKAEKAARLAHKSSIGHDRLSPSASLAISYNVNMILSRCANTEDRSDIAATHWNLARDLLFSETAMPRVDLDLDRLRCVFTGFEIQSFADSYEWMKSASVQLTLMLESRELFTKQAEMLHAMYITFHAKWLNHSIRGDDPSHIPLILGAIHARQLARRLSDSQSLENTSLNPDIRQLIESRRSLGSVGQALTASIAESWELKKAYVQAIVEKDPRADEYLQQALGVESQKQGLREDQQKASRTFRHKISELETSEALEHPYHEFNIADISGKLEPSEVAILLIDLTLPPIGSVTKTDLLTGVFIYPNEEVHCLEFIFNLDDLDLRLQPSDLSRMRQRSGPTNSLGRDSATNFKTYNQNIETNLWQPIRQHLPPGITKLHLISSGRFQQLPADFGSSSNIMILHYPSLLFFGNTYHSLPARYHASAVPCSVEDLPFARREGILIDQIAHARAKQNNREDSPHFDYDCLHIAGHGFRSRDRYRGCQLGILQCGPEHELTEEDIYSSTPLARRVWLSACVSGKTDEDKEGDPVGLIIPFLARGTRDVIASIRPIPELWTPLFVSLCEWISLDENIDIHNAIRRAHITLETGELDGEFVELYRHWFTDTCYSWFHDGWSGDDENPWLSAQPDQVLAFRRNLLEEIGKNFCMDRLTELELLGQEPDIELFLEKVMEFLLTTSLNPPREVCELFKHSFKIYSSRTNFI